MKIEINLFARIIFILLIIISTGCAIKQSSTPIQIDKKWVTQSLQNGLEYYLYPMESETIELRMIVNVGSLNELPSQRGYAHFIEHMAFNNTVNFPEGVLFDELGDFGSILGPDLNGVTDYSRTIYTLTLPNRSKLNQALLWFSDILDKIQFEYEDVQNEKQIIFGEWRLDDKESKIWEMQLYDSLLTNTQFEDKDPIGKEDILKQVTPEKLKQFYHQWYQPERVKLIVVGDIDPERFHRQIQQIFPKKVALKNQASPQNIPEKHQIYQIQKEIEYPEKLLSQRGQSAAFVLSFDLGKYIFPTTLEAQTELWFEWMIMDALESRLKDEFDHKGLPVESIRNNFAYLPGLNHYELVLKYQAANRSQLLAQLASGLASLRDHGLTQHEFAGLMKRFENMGYALFATQATEIAQNAVHELFFNQLPQDESQLSQNYSNFLKEIHLNKLNAGIREFLSKDNKDLTFVFNQNEASQNMAKMTQDFLNQLSQKGKKFDYEKIKIKLPEPKLVNTKGVTLNMRANNLYEWTLVNGLNTQFYRMKDMDQITYFILRAKGGIAALTIQERAALDMLYQTYINGRLKDIAAFDFFKSLKDAGITIEPAVYSSTHDFSVTTHSENAQEALKALIYIMENIDPSESAFIEEKERILQSMDNLNHSPYDIFQRSVKRMVYPANSYDYPIKREIYEAVKFQDVKQVYQKLFGDIGHFNLYIVSEQPAEMVKNWVSKYLSHLTAQRLETLPKEVLFNQKGGELIEYKSPEYRTFIETLHITDVGKRNVQSLFIEEIISRILQKRYTQIMREQYAFDYDPNIYSWGRDGDDIHVTTVTALIAPDREDQLKTIWPKIIASLTSPVTHQEQEVAQHQFQQDLSKIRLNGKYMVAALARYGTWGYDQRGLLEPQSIFAEIDNHQLNRFTHSIFNQSIHFRSVLRPEKNKFHTHSLQIDLGSQL